MIVNVRGRVSEWVEHRVVSEETAQRILAFEESKESNAWVGYGIAAVGVTALTTGVISIVAANWESLSDTAKIAGYFVAQALLGACVVWGINKRMFWREAFINLFALFFWAGIAVVGQVYNLDGPAWMSISLWLALALPAALIANSRYLPSIWCATALADVFFWAFEGRSSEIEVIRRFGVVTAVPLLMTALFFWSKGRGLVQEEFRAALLQFGLTGIIAVGTPIVDVLWENGARSLSIPTGMTRHLLIPWVAALIASGTALTARQSSERLRIVNASLIVTATVYLTLPFMATGVLHLSDTRRMLISAFGFIMVWSLAAASAVLADRKVFYTAATFVIACRFIVAYFQVFGSLTTTGLGLVISGLVILGVGGLWDRLRRQVVGGR